MNRPSETFNWVSKRTGRSAEIKLERAKVTHVDWNTVQLLFEVADNNANGVYSLIQFTDAMVTELNASLLVLGDRSTLLENRATALESRTTVLENRAATLESVDTTLANRTTALEGRATTLESRATGAENRLNTLEQTSPVYVSATAPTDTDAAVLWVQLLD